MKEKMEIFYYKIKPFFIVKNIRLELKRQIIDCKKLFATHVRVSRWKELTNGNNGKRWE